MGSNPTLSATRRSGSFPRPHTSLSQKGCCDQPWARGTPQTDWPVELKQATGTCYQWARTGIATDLGSEVRLWAGKQIGEDAEAPHPPESAQVEGCAQQSPLGRHVREATQQESPSP